MDTSAIVLIILLVLGVIASNLMLLKYSAKFKFPTNKDADTAEKLKKKTDLNYPDKGSATKNPTGSNTTDNPSTD